MTHIAVIAITGVVAAVLGSPAAAESYRCTSLAGAPAVTFAATTRHSSGAWAVISAKVQIEGDISYSTDAQDPRDRAAVDHVEIDDDEVAFDLEAGQVGGPLAASVHLLTVSEGAHELTGGVLHVVAGGLWVVQCDVDHAG
jgi:hypothetical protein